MDNVPPRDDRQVPSDCPGLGRERVGRPDEFTGRGHNAVPFPDHGDDGARADVGDQVSEEGFRREVLVVLLCERARRGEELEGGELEALALEAADDLSD